MPNTVGRNLNLCFTKIKRPLESESKSSFQSPDDKHPILVKNYLYDHVCDDSLSSSASAEPDFATVYASQRFFFSTPGSSNSISDSKPSVATQSEASVDDTVISIEATRDTEKTTRDTKDDDLPLVRPWNSLAVKDSVAVPKYSPDPYTDFRRSMQEMVEARDPVDVGANWDYLHELLLCYLSLNPKSTHKFIVGAFVDLLVSLLSPSEKQSNDNRQERNMEPGHCDSPRQCK